MTNRKLTSAILLLVSMYCNLYIRGRQSFFKVPQEPQRSDFRNPKENTHTHTGIRPPPTLVLLDVLKFVIIALKSIETEKNNHIPKHVKP